MKRRTVATLAASLTLVAVPVGAAQDPNETQYDNPTTNVPTERPSTVGATVDTSAGGVQAETLPFTGTELGVALLIGGAAVAGGFALRRAGRRSADR